MTNPFESLKATFRLQGRTVLNADDHFIVEHEVDGVLLLVCFQDDPEAVGYETACGFLEGPCQDLGWRFICSSSRCVRVVKGNDGYQNCHHSSRLSNLAETYLYVLTFPNDQANGDAQASASEVAAS